MVKNNFLSSSTMAQYGEADTRPKEGIEDLPIGGDNRNLYTSKIIKAGALLADTTTLFANWDESQSATQNLQRARSDNIFGKASRARIKDILAIFRQRYLHTESITKALTYLVKNHFPKPALDCIFYFHAAQSDRLLHDVVTEVLAERHSRGRIDISIKDMYSAISQWVREGKTTGRWSEETTLRVTQGVMSTLRDFGLLQGAVSKRLSPIYLPVTAFSYIAFYLHTSQPSGERLIESPEWGLFLRTTNEVERLFMEAHQQRLLEYYAAGPVIRITFPSRSIEEYAHVISERAL
jgi:hypothetical protein